MILLRRRALTGGDMPGPGPGPGPTPGGSAAGDLLVGQTVAIKESGTPIPYLVVHQGNPDAGLYDASCEGTWLLRQDIRMIGIWNSDNKNKLNESDIMAAMAGFLNDYEMKIQQAIKQVKIPYYVGGGTIDINSGPNGLQCKIFPLSCYEIGMNINASLVDSAKLSYFESGIESSAMQKRIAELNGSSSDWFLRTASVSVTHAVYVVSANGAIVGISVSAVSGYRPAFILPYDYQFEESEVIS
jgi:hypothetical protein